MSPFDWYKLLKNLQLDYITFFFQFKITTKKKRNYELNSLTTKKKEKYILII